MSGKDINICAFKPLIEREESKSPLQTFVIFFLPCLMHLSVHWDRRPLPRHARSSVQRETEKQCHLFLLMQFPLPWLNLSSCKICIFGHSSLSLSLRRTVHTQRNRKIPSSHDRTMRFFFLSHSETFGSLSVLRLPPLAIAIVAGRFSLSFSPSENG